MKFHEVFFIRFQMKYPYKAKISYETTEIQNDEIIKIEKSHEINVNLYFCKDYIILLTDSGVT